MNLTLRSSSLRISGLAVLVGAISALSAQAVPLYWVGSATTPALSGTGTWNQTFLDNQWSNNNITSSGQAWAQGSDAFFTGSVGGNVTITDAITAATITFDTGAGPFTIIDGAALTVTATGGISNLSGASKPLQNRGTLEIAGTATITPISLGAGITLANGGSFDITETSSPVVTLTSLTNTLSYFDDDIVPNLIVSPGQVTVGRNNLTLTDFTMSTVAGDDLSFTIGNVAPGSSTARITVTGGVFNDPNSATKTTINFGNGGPVQAGTYDLINFAGATVTGFASTAIPANALLDYELGSLPQNVSSATLRYDPTGTILQLVAVPEPATLMMPMAAVLGMAWLRRRTARMAR